MMSPKTIESLRCFEGLGVRIWYDGVTRQHHDNVMGIFYEEQVLTWKFLGDKLLKTISSTAGEIDFLDVGTGSGFWAILVAKQLQKLGRAAQIIAIDKVERAVEVCKQNMTENNIEFTLKQQAYQTTSAPTRGVKVIFMNPPYHIYPSILEEFVPHHARGGAFGYQEFISWLSVADYYLAEGGSIFFHDMCLGNEYPEFLRFIPLFINGSPSIYYYEIFPPKDTFSFLRAVYEYEFAPFIYETAIRFPRVFFTSGVIVKDGFGDSHKEEVSDDLLAGASWQDRISLHKSIAEIAKTMMSRGD